MFRLLKLIIFWPLTILLILVVLFISLSYLFQHKIERAALGQLLAMTNNQLSYEGAELNYFTTFPSITLDLIEPKFYDIDYNEAISLEKFQAELNMVQAIFSKPSISHLLIKNGLVRLTERNNKWNVQDIMSTENKGSSASRMIDIENITIENFKVIIDRGSSKELYELMMTEATMKLLQSDGQLKIETEGQIALESVTRQNRVQAIGYEDNVSVTLEYDTQSKRLDIQECVFRNGIDVSGSFNTLNSQRDILVKVTDFPLKKLNPVLRHLDKSKFGVIKLVGSADSQVHLDHVDDVDYNITLNQAGMSYGTHDHKVKVKAVDAKISGNGQLLKIKEILAKVEGKPIAGSAEFDMARNKINSLDLHGQLPVKFLFPWIRNSTVTAVKGLIELDRLVIENYQIDQPIGRLLQSMQLSAKPNDLQLKLADKPWVSFKSGEIKSAGKRLLFENIAVTFGESDLSLDAEYSQDAERPYISAELSSKFLVADSLMSYFSSSDSSSTKPLTHHHFDINVDIEHATYGKVVLENLMATLSSKGKGIKIISEADAFAGSMSTEGTLYFRRQLYHFLAKTDIEDVDIAECLRQSDNFGQTYITDQNIKGRVNSLGLYNFYWDTDWNILTSKSRGLVSLNVQNGELLNLDILKQFSSYVKVQDLNKVRFIELDNYLEITGKNVYIPTMFIQSNAANFTMSGHHSTDNELLYNLQVNAGQILMDKFRKHNRSLRPKAAKQKGWFNLYYVVESDGKNYTYKKDRSRVEAALSNGLLRKEQIYKKLLDEFGFSDKLKLPTDW